MEISHDKKQALKQILHWYANDTDQQQFLTLGGYAGTGKTTLVAILRSVLASHNPKLKVAFAAFTGKAARVLQNYLQARQLLRPGDSVGTIHSLIYSVLENDQHEIIGWQRKQKIKADLIVIDEASMVDQQIWQDLLTYGVPILAVGDHGQLPPVQGRFNLMENPQLQLQEIHRQLVNHPIIKLSVLARETGLIPPGNYGPTVRKLSKTDPEGQEVVDNYLQSYNQDTLVLCGYNNTRIRLNNYLRSLLGFEGALPQAGDRLICLRNKPAAGLFNGMLGTLEQIRQHDQHFFDVKIAFTDAHQRQEFEGLALKQQFGSSGGLNFTRENRALLMKGELFDFAYALTVHKAQGSQAKRVILFEERFKQMSDLDWRRWLYTAVTRAEEELIILGD